MTREEAYSQCLAALGKSNFTLVELPTGYGKSYISIRMTNHIIETSCKNKSEVSILLLVAKTAHKGTWKDELAKWGGIKGNANLIIECYESLHKHTDEHFDIIIMDECHHLNSDLRHDLFSTISFHNVIGLSATIPQKLKQYFLYKYHAQTVLCNITDAIKDGVLPEPQIILYPLELDNVHLTETIEINPKVKGSLYHGSFSKLWSYRKMKVHAIISCTQRQKLNDMNSQILFQKNSFMRTHKEYTKNKWLFSCGERIKYLANLKNSIVKDILSILADERTLTFCKTIEQAECLGKYCIHSKNPHSELIYKNFNDKKINHITSVNILNENANLVDCKYAIFANYSSSEVCSVQRCGRALRHKSPVIIMPFYKNTREEEILTDMIKDFNPDSIHTVYSLTELQSFLKK